uniref:Uncharacterized protein n=1 Tax=Rhizophora mucronata TaxID=61149 RepID=A0A2P2PX15_RHIMU
MRCLMWLCFWLRVKGQ